MIITSSNHQAIELIDTLNEMASGEINPHRLEEIIAAARRLEDAGQNIQAWNVLGMVAALRGDSFEVERRFKAAIQCGGNDVWTLGNYATALNYLVGIIQKNKHHDPLQSGRGEPELYQSQFIGAAPGNINDIAEHKRMEEASSVASDLDFRSLAENIPDNVVRWDKQGRYVYINPALERTLATPDVIGKTKSEAFPDGRFALVEQTIAQVVATGEMVRLLRQFVPAENGEMRLHDLILVPEFDETGQVISVLGIGRDMTDFYRMQEALAEREQEFRSLAENSPDNIIRWDCRGRYLYINPTHERLLGIPASKIVGQEIFDTHVNVKEAIARVVATGQPALCVRQRVFDARGELVYHEVRVLPERDSTGRIVGVLGIGRDMTDIYRMQDAITAREQEFRSLAENLPDNISRWDIEGRYLYINPTHERLLGIPVSKIVGQKIFDTHVKVKEAIARVVATGQSILLVHQRVYDARGELTYHEVRLLAERDSAGRIVGVLGIGRDMTDIYRMQDAIAVREHEFRSLADSSPDNLIRNDHDGRIRSLNATLVNLLGLSSAEEVIGKRASEAWPDGRFDKLAQAQEQAVETAANKIIELTVPGTSGELEYHQISVVPERDATGAIIGTIAYGRDITAIRVAEHQLAHFIESLPGLAYTFRLSPDGHICFPYVSSAIDEFYGLKPDDVKNDAEPIHKLAHPDDRPRIDAAIAKSAQMLEPFRVESRVCRPGLPERWLDVRAVPEREPDGGIVWRGIMLDITERKRIEFDLEESRIQLRGLIAHHENIREEERKYIARELHDELGQAMTGLKMNVQMLASKIGEDSPIYAHAQKTEALMTEAMGVVRNISTALRPVELDMGIVPALEWMVLRFSTLTSIECRLHIERNEINPEAYRSIALFRIAQESLTNVAKHAQATRVDITLGINADDYVLKVRDNGCGFDSSVKKTNSFGLLGIRERVIMLGGTFSINSAHGHGTEIVVQIPVGEKRD